MSTLQFLPGTLDISAYQGDTLSFSLTFKDANDVAIDVTGYTFEAHILDTCADDTQVLPVQMTCSVIDGPTGLVGVTVDSADTTPLNGEYVYDLQGTSPGGGVRTYLAGKLDFSCEVTR